MGRINCHSVRFSHFLKKLLYIIPHSLVVVNSDTTPFFASHQHMAYNPQDKRAALEQYAYQRFKELNPHIEGQLNMTLPPSNAHMKELTDLMSTPLVRTSLHGATQEKVFNAYFLGSLEDFEKNPSMTKWSASGEDSKKPTIGAGVDKKGADSLIASGEYVTLHDGTIGRLMLKEATVVSTQNTSSVPVGVTINGLPTNSEVFSGKGPSRFHVIIPPHVQSPFPEQQRIFVDHALDNHEYVHGLLQDNRRTNLTKSSIESSILYRPKESELHERPAWDIRVGSQLYHKANELALNEGNANSTLFTIPNHNDPSSSIVAVDHDTALRAYNALHAEVAASHFPNPLSVGVEIKREDSLQWTDPAYHINNGKKFGEDPNFKSKLFLKNRETIGIKIKATYVVCRVDGAHE